MDNTLGGFLQSRRARIQPEDVGLPPYGRRRVPGLRREEVAQLAGVSVDYYIRLEQGRGRHVSDAVLDAVARVLRLDATERAHLRDLARPGQAHTVAPVPGAVPSPAVRPGVRLMLDSFHDTPAFVLGRRMDVLAWNALADALHGFSTPGASRNMLQRVFLDPAAGDIYPDWSAVAAESVAYTRLRAGRHQDDEELEALVAELSTKSADFRRLWDDHLVKEKTYGVKRLVHPVVGRMDFGYETLALPGDPEQTIVVYTAPPGSASEERLRMLASWTAKSTAGVGGHGGRDCPGQGADPAPDHR
ncbi:Helix-turn-helix domain-containing protein [Actinacidiphila alni]|uniref:Helix-turn-helix domain-containing protein n=1 Tax=Actinacidiphila alni TaxID=380248 RepID=A0A1I2E5Q8_9ACTN|nr:helix-turn-helix transcriptional regulator [Actinacidiphila alni]SFE87976.1 Helix-turn-helix domain-containing protein [Actinacidiphila alni]